ncbi:MAG: NAD-dependent epimerase/dehydratase family protein [Candidatus Schekmanbacteria bacterium]|nr:MAG: NAD-dependent epimerase/dehydratase family protein [Candidatus Schekmanbacteria bacterium]
MFMKVLVTGGCGFLGSHVCEFYIKKGAEVIAFDNMTKHELQRTGFVTDVARTYNWNYLKNIGVKMVKADVRDFDILLKESDGCDYIVHTAAQPAMTISWEDPVLDFTTNVVGTFNVLEVARKLEIPVASCATIHIYGNKINEELKEEETRYRRTPPSIDEGLRLLQGTLSPLHASKSAGDIYVRTYIDTYNLKAASFRLTGIYGPRQLGGEDHGWVANFSIRAVMNWPLTIFGTGKQVRDILYATDVAEAFDAFYNNQVPGVYNIGGGEKNAISLIECIDLIGKIRGEKPQVKFENDRFGDLRYFICNIEKAKKNLHWEPKVLPEEGIKNLIEWVSENRNLFGN